MQREYPDIPLRNINHVVWEGIVDFFSDPQNSRLIWPHRNLQPLANVNPLPLPGTGAAPTAADESRTADSGYGTSGALIPATTANNSSSPVLVPVSMADFDFNTSFVGYYTAPLQDPDFTLGRAIGPPNEETGIPDWYSQFPPLEAPDNGASSHADLRNDPNSLQLEPGVDFFHNLNPPGGG
jgi:hypothetical protein